ncbi:hypothetical protein ES288_A06G113900v1 [Gossypium darwinii]|uniref:Uncharacterized protein n=1 Tax=Gossypium darwinii TaxID=34276 RepID=A0A5D2G5J0_GOSDA|nr:hypothetical protein ES288_A06G113900v1 [Gossypium darwinii]
MKKKEKHKRKRKLFNSPASLINFSTTIVKTIKYPTPFSSMMDCVTFYLLRPPIPFLEVPLQSKSLVNPIVSLPPPLCAPRGSPICL